LTQILAGLFKELLEKTVKKRDEDREKIRKEEQQILL
jgi:hypothetical protein